MSENCTCGHSLFFHNSRFDNCGIVSCKCMKFATDGQPIGFKKTYTGPLDALTNEMGRSFGISITKSKETDNKFSTRLWTKTYSSAIKGATLEESIRKALIIFRRGRRY